MPRADGARRNKTAEETAAASAKPPLKGDGLAMLTRTMTLIAGGAAQAVVLDAIVRGVEGEHPGMLCSILLLDASGQHLLHGAAPSLPDFYTQAIDGVMIGPSAGSCGTAAHTRQRVIVTDVQTDPLWTAYRDLAGQAGLVSCWSEPIFGAGERLLGTFAMCHREVRTPTAEDMAAILTAAHLAAIAIERRQAVEALEASEARAERAAASEQATAKDLDTFFNVSPDLLSIADTDRLLINLNQSWESVLGYAFRRGLLTPWVWRVLALVILALVPFDLSVMIHANAPRPAPFGVGILGAAIAFHLALLAPTVFALLHNGQRLGAARTHQGVPAKVLLS